MAIITKPANIQKNVPASFSLNKAELIALPIVSSNPYFSVMSNWNKVTLFYSSSVGNQKAVLTFDASQATPTSNFLVSSKARDVFQIQKILISDFDNGIFEVPRSALTVAEFDIDFSVPVPVLLYEINPISTVADISVLTGSGRGFVSISQPIYVTSIELKFVASGSPNSGQNVQDLRVRIVSQNGATVLGTSDLPGLDIPYSEIAQSIPGSATWRVFNFSTPVLVSDAKLAIRFEYTSYDRVSYFVASATPNEVSAFDPGIRVTGYNA